MTGEAVLFAEDPGAVNCIAPIAEALVARGESPRLLSSGLATAMFDNRGLVAQGGWSDEEALSERPRLLVVGTSENRLSPALRLIDAARHGEIPSAAIIDSSANSAERFRGRDISPLAHAPDNLLVPDAQARDAFRELGFPAEYIHVVGHPNDDRVRAVARRLSLQPRKALRQRIFPSAGDRPVLIFVSEISGGLAKEGYKRGPDYTLHGRGGRHLRSEIVVEELLDAVAEFQSEGLPRPYLVLRRHPKETVQDLSELATGFDEVSQGGDAHEMLFSADVVAGMTTMLLNEAHLLGTPTLSILPRRVERAWLAAVRDNAVASVTTREELHSELRRLLTAKIPRGPAMEDGETIGRILAVLDRMSA